MRRSIIRRTFEPLDPRRALPEGRAWYVFITAPKREFQIACHIEEQGKFSLIPIEYRWRAVTRHGRKNVKRQRVEIPLIPRVVVIGLAPDDVPADVVRNNYHIIGVFGMDGKPARLHKGELRRLQATSDALLAPKAINVPQVGKKARMTTPGLFHNHVVEVKSITGKHAKIIQSWFNSPREVDVELSELEAACTTRNTKDSGLRRGYTTKWPGMVSHGQLWCGDL